MNDIILNSNLNDDKNPVLELKWISQTQRHFQRLIYLENSTSKIYLDFGNDLKQLMEIADQCQ